MHYRVALALFVPIIVGSFVSFTSADSYSIENLNDESTKVGNLREENAVEEERGGGAFKNLFEKAVPTWMRSTTRENAVAQNVVRTSSRKSTQAVTGAAKTAGKHRISELTTTGLNLSSSQQVVHRKLWKDTEAFAAMCAIIAVCARDGDAQMPIEQRLSKETITIAFPTLFVTLLSLCLLDFDFAQVVDVSWRLDYVARSSGAGSVQEPLYFVQLYVQSPRTSGDVGLQTVLLTCSVEELRVLVYRIQEAANEVEKLMTGTPSQFRRYTSA
uniref:COMM domain-containing protein 3 n=1 Tax=Hyaloperonospora arabidopsidis (strain Emoy2) TaxID=559515 RepID=M4C2W3_HYAAE